MNAEKNLEGIFLFPKHDNSQLIFENSWVRISMARLKEESPDDY
jgi:hypothetical protein